MHTGDYPNQSVCLVLVRDLGGGGRDKCEEEDQKHPTGYSCFPGRIVWFLGPQLLKDRPSQALTPFPRSPGTGAWGRFAPFPHWRAEGIMGRRVGCSLPQSRSQQLMRRWCGHLGRAVGLFPHRPTLQGLCGPDGDRSLLVSLVLPGMEDAGLNQGHVFWTTHGAPRGKRSSTHLQGARVSQGLSRTALFFFFFFVCL